MRLENKTESRRFAERLADELRPGDVLRLDGDLGAGKTTITQWIGERLGVVEKVQSPTFSLVRHYPCKYGTLNHIDLYRMEAPEEIEALDYEELFWPDGITVIEWAERAEEYLPPDVLRIRLSKAGGEAREVELLSSGGRSEELRKLFGKGGVQCV